MRTRRILTTLGLSAALVMSGAGMAPAADYPPVPQKVTCKAKAVSNKSKIKIDMGPDLPGELNYTFKIEKKVSGQWLQLQRDYLTQGPTETRTINVRKGLYRFKCYSIVYPTANPKLDARSNAVKIKR